MTGTVVEIRGHNVKIEVDGDGHAFIPFDSLSDSTKKRIKVGSRIKVIERKRSREDTGEWIVSLIHAGEYGLTRVKPES